MKIIFLVLNLILLFLFGVAQQNYYNKRFDFGQSSSEGGSSIVVTDSGCIVLFNTTNSPGSSGLLQSGLLFLGDSGNIQKIKLYSVPYDFILSGAWGDLIKLPNKQLISGGTLEDTLQSDAILTKYDSLQNILWMRVFGDTASQGGNMCRHNRTGYSLLGTTNSFNYQEDILLIKTDSNGIEQWQQHYGGTQYESGTSMDTCFDGGMIISGYTTSYGVGAGSHFGNAYAIKVDSMGIMKWSRTFGDIYDDGFWNCLQCKDGSYVFAGYYAFYDPYYPSNCCFSHSKPFIVKLDSAGNTIWSKTYGDTAIANGLFSIKELSNGDLISVGEYVNDTVNFEGFRGLIIRVNSNGDSLWYFTYAGLPGFRSDSYLHDIALDKDGGFVATGWVYPKPPDTGSQDIWVLKIDSNGCEVSNCLVNYISTVLQEKNSLKIYPNPSDGLFFIQNEIGDIEKLELFNYTGERVFYKEGNSNEINLRNAADGIYFYEAILKNNKICKGKIVKHSL